MNVEPLNPGNKRKIERIFRYSTGLAVFNACLGLFGLASFMAERRTKEIGIRKMLDAKVSEIVFLLSKEFIKWIIIANIIAWPLAYFIGNKWLQNFHVLYFEDKRSGMIRMNKFNPSVLVVVP